MKAGRNACPFSFAFGGTSAVSSHFARAGDRRSIPLCNCFSYRWLTRVGDNFVSSELMHDLDSAIKMLDQGRTGLDPIAAVVIGNVDEFMNGGAVDVSAKNAVHSIAFRVFNYRRFKLADETNSVFDPLLDVGAERPVAEP